jgi:signal transduction histidine kinase/HAMP domain-containing protein
MRIATKVWICMAVLAGGYVATVAIGGVLTRINERRLARTATVLFPAATTAQEALAGFNVEVKGYEDAVTLGDGTALATAETTGRRVVEGLELIAGSPGLDPVRRQEARALIGRMDGLAADAGAVYGPMARGESSPELTRRAAVLAASTGSLRSDLDALVGDLRNDLRAAIDGINAATTEQRTVSELASVVIVTLALAFTAVTTTGWTRRLWTLLGASRTLADGRYDTQVTDHGGDEVGQLAQSFERMRLAVQGRDHDLRRFNETLEAQVRQRTGELEAKNRALGEEVAERQRAERSLRLLDAAVGQLSEGVVITAQASQGDGLGIEYANPGFWAISGRPPAADAPASVATLFAPAAVPAAVSAAFGGAAAGAAATVEVSAARGDGSERILDWHVAPIRDGEGNIAAVASVIRDITERRILESQRSQGQKLESIGQLAAGVAHEINTPIQFVGDNLRFMGDSFGELGGFFDSAAALRAIVGDGAEAAAFDAALVKADVPYLREEMPKAVQQGLEGVERVSTIIKALKEFSHPDNGSMQMADLHKAIDSTLNVSRNEYKYVAELVTAFDPALPLVECVVGEINQVVLNMVVNASHAIADANRDGGGRGTITISTRACGDHVELRIADTGTGIPEHVRSRIFDPFYTTKEVGKGTGQGLFIAHEVVAKRHHGTIAVETEVGRGTTFVITLPVRQAPLVTTGG